MKIKLPSIFIIMLLLGSFIISCNNSTIESEFTIKLDVVIKKNDSIHTYYTTDGSINFNEKNSFWTKVKGDKKNQTIVINFPPNVVPNQFRLDLGANVHQDHIVLNKLECAYKGKTVELKGKEIYKLLRVDESNTILDKNLGILKRMDSTNKNGPSLYPNGDVLRKKLEELTSAKKN
ncbi:hypothetical protein [Flavobacterium sp.]|uniref:hypothetical protein n=1 Tax=Flavobacterium sp. TaxID=239 RepID=UPI002B4AAE81|nr:hypothetical protein [Flavobacterium sp.]HLP63326.1 hypothetical protein [Flavobacterium sp.]